MPSRFQRIRIKLMEPSPGERRRTGADMIDLDALDRNILELKQWLNGAWRHLARPSLTKFERRELRNEMKQCNVELRRCLELVRNERARRRTPSPAGKQFSNVSDFKLIGRERPRLR